MSAKTHRIIGIILLLLAAVISILNLQRTAHLGAKTVPFVLILGGAMQLRRARKLEKQTP